MKKTKILLFFFSFVTLLDFFISLAVKIKQPHFNEANPIYLATGSLLPLFIMKIITIGLFWFFLIKLYTYSNVYARYIVTTFFLLGTIAQVAVIPGAFVEYNKEPAEVLDVPVEVRQEKYKSSITKPISYLFTMILIFFIFWRIIERDQFGGVVDYDKRRN